MPQPFRVGLTRDFLKPDGSVGFGDIGLEMLDQTHGLSWDFLPYDEPILTSESIDGYDALLVLGPRVTRDTLVKAEQLIIVARFGVGWFLVGPRGLNRWVWEGPGRKVGGEVGLWVWL